VEITHVGVATKSAAWPQTCESDTQVKVLNSIKQ